MASELKIGEAAACACKRATLDNTLPPQVTNSGIGEPRVVQGGSFVIVCDSLPDFKSTGHTARAAGLTPRKLSLHLAASPIPWRDDMM